MLLSWPYSERNATTGSFLLAYLDGISPAITVNVTLIVTRIIAPIDGNDETLFIPDKFSIRMLIVNINNGTAILAFIFDL